MYRFGKMGQINIFRDCVFNVSGECYVVVTPILFLFSTKMIFYVLMFYDVLLQTETA